MVALWRFPGENDGWIFAQTPKWEWLPLQVAEEWKPNPPCGEGHRDTQKSVMGFISMVFYPSCVRVDCRNMSIRRNCRRDSRCLAEAWVDMAGRGIRAETSSIESDAEVQSGLILASLRWWLMTSIWMLHPHWKWDCASDEALWPKEIWERSFGAGNISSIKHLCFFSDSAANGWRHNKRYCLIYTCRFCGKCEQLKNMKASINLFRICSRKTNFLSWEPGDASAVFVQTPFSDVMHWRFWKYGHGKYKSRCSKWPMCFYWFKLAWDIHRPTFCSFQTLEMFASANLEWKPTRTHWLLAFLWRDICTENKMQWSFPTLAMLWVPGCQFPRSM